MYNLAKQRGKRKYPRGEAEMATRIYNTDTKQVVELECLSDGQDFLADVIGGCDQDGRYASVEMPDDADFAMGSEDLGWWRDWATREERILDKANEIGEEAIKKLCELGGEYGYDLGLLQDKEEEFLGISE